MITRTFIQLWTLFFGVFLLMTGQGMTFTGLIVRASEEGFSQGSLGILQSSYQAGWALAALIAPLLLTRVGHIRVFAAVAALASAIMLSYELHIAEWLWIIERLIHGGCIAGLMVLSESWLNEKSANAVRGTMLSIYTLCGWGAPVLGVWLLEFFPPNDYRMFLVSSALISIAVIPMMLTASSQPIDLTSERTRVSELFVASPLGTLGTLLTGITHGAFFASLAIYATSIGMAVKEIATISTIALLAGVVVQWPFGFISDRVDRRIVMLAACVLGLLAAVYGFLATSEDNVVPLYISLFGLGATLIPLYNLAIAQVHDHIPAERVVAATGTLVLIYALGSVIGPTLVSQSMQWFGNQAFFGAQALMLGTFTLYIIFRMSRRDSVPLVDQESYNAFVPSSPYSAVISTEEYYESELASETATDKPERDSETVN
ncbi:MFS transporter [Gammaproteobacteria bacterium]|nr:MFS transporter [Gammaproteobacteria bacterium]